MDQQIKKLTQQIRAMRQGTGAGGLCPEKFSEEYRELAEEIQSFFQQEREIVHQEQVKLKMIHQAISSGMWSMTFDEEGKMETVIWSPEFRQMLGFQKEEEFPNVLESWSSRLHPDDKYTTMEAYWKTVEQAGKYDVEYRLLSRNGEYRWYHAIGETVRRLNGKAQLFIGVFIDITQKKEKEKAIQEKLRAQDTLKKMRHELEMKNEILNALCADFNSVYIVNLDTGHYEIFLMAKSLIKRVSDISFKNHMYDRAMDMYISRWVEDGEVEYVRHMTDRERVKRMLQEKGRVSFRYRVKDREDGQKNFEFSFCDISKHPGEHMMVLGVRNVDALIDEKEEYRKETLSQVEETLAGAHTGLWHIDFEDDMPVRMYGDGMMKKLLNITEEISPEKVFEKWFAGIDEGYTELVRKKLEKGISGEFREVVYPGDYSGRGKVYMRFGAVQDQSYQGSGYRLRGYYQDVTETMEEKQLREETLAEALLEARKASQVKTEFLSHMSHDIRTPINGILGILTIADKEIDNVDRQLDCHQKIRKSAEHLLSLVNDVLDISRLESGVQNLTEETFELAEVLDSCMSILRPQAELDGLLWKETRGELVHHVLRGNALHLRQILINIIGNAVKYNKKNGSICVDTRELREEDGKIWIRFEVSDTGIGMSEEYQEHIFEAFTQENSGARTAYAGSGLGMAITKKLVDQMGGTLVLKSTLGEGSVFTVTLPFKSEQAQENISEDERITGDISGMHVLVAEDNELNREIVEYLLEDAGASVVSAENGEVLLEKFAASSVGTFDCIIMDVMMPVMDGLEAARKIRAMERKDAKKIPIIALSANAFAEDVRRSREAGMDRHVSKPLDAEQLFRVMTSLKRGSKRTSSYHADEM